MLHLNKICKEFYSQPFNPMVETFSRNAKNKIIFTDGYAFIPEREYNAIWIVSCDKEEVFGGENPKGGNVVFIDE